MDCYCPHNSVINNNKVTKTSIYLNKMILEYLNQQNNKHSLNTIKIL